MSVIQNRQEKFRAPGLFALVGVGLVVGYSLHLAGFAGWMTLAVAGASLLAAGAQGEKTEGEECRGDAVARREVRSAFGGRNLGALENGAVGAQHIDGAQDHAPGGRTGHSRRRPDLDVSSGCHARPL